MAKLNITLGESEYLALYYRDKEGTMKLFGNCSDVPALEDMIRDLCTFETMDDPDTIIEHLSNYRRADSFNSDYKLILCDYNEADSNV